MPHSASNIIATHTSQPPYESATHTSHPCIADRLHGCSPKFDQFNASLPHLCKYFIIHWKLLPTIFGESNDTLWSCIALLFRSLFLCLYHRLNLCRAIRLLYIFVTLLLLLLKRFLIHIVEDYIIINYTNSKLLKMK